jgi:predicted GNAT family acetyltransferase
MAFLVSTYEVAANLGGWDRDLLECAHGRPRQARAPNATRTIAALATDGTVEREDGPSKGRYRLVVDGVEAEMSYSRVSASQIIIDHTEIPDALRGRKVGARLLQQAIEDARQDKVVIIPLCPFAKAMIGRHPEWQDVLPPSKT